MNLSAEGMPFATEMIVDAAASKARITEIAVSYRVRNGRTKLNPFKVGLRILGTIVRLMRDTKPLLFFGILAGIMWGAGTVLGAGIVVEWYRTGTVGRIPTAILAALLIIGSIQFFALGLVADMIKRLRLKQNNMWMT